MITAKEAYDRIAAFSDRVAVTWSESTGIVSLYGRADDTHVEISVHATREEVMGLCSREYWAPAYGYIEEADALNGCTVRRERREDLYRTATPTGQHSLVEWVAEGRETATHRLRDWRVQTSLRYPTMPCAVAVTMPLI
jgi:hypothetical protein